MYAASLQYLHTQMADGRTIHRIIHNNRNTTEHQNIKNMSGSYMQSIGAYFKSIINEQLVFCKRQALLEFKHTRSFPVN